MTCLGFLALRKQNEKFVANRAGNIKKGNHGCKN